ncbi:MAG: hypothetical protein ACRDRJ_16060 [Streptosporangiaceae bacterium]
MSRLQAASVAESAMAPLATPARNSSKPARWWVMSCSVASRSVGPGVRSSAR